MYSGNKAKIIHQEWQGCLEQDGIDWEIGHISPTTNQVVGTYQNTPAQA
jgi:hypothetical protein